MYELIKRGIKNTTYLVIATILTQIIGFIGLVYVTRNLGPQEYGIYVTVLAFVSFFNFINLPGIRKVLTREVSKEPNLSNKYLQENILLNLFCSSIVLVICLTANNFTAYDPSIKNLITLFSFLIVIESLSNFFSVILVAKERIKLLSKIGIVKHIISSTTYIYLVYSGFGAPELLASYIFIQFIYLIFIYYITDVGNALSFISGIKWNTKYLKSSVIFSLITITGYLSLRIDILMISFMGDSSEVGIYKVSTIIATYSHSVRNLAGLVFFPIFTKLFEKSKNVLVLRKLLFYSLTLTVLVFTILFLLSPYIPEITAIVFGEQYKDSGKILAILLFYSCFTWMTLPFTLASQALKKEFLILKIYTFMGVMNISLNYFFYNEFGLIGIAYSTLLVYGIGGVSQTIYLYFSLKKVLTVDQVNNMHSGDNYAVAKLYDNKEYLEAYSSHTDLRIASNPHSAVGGHWEKMGNLQFDFLVNKGLRKDHAMLDLGCGTLRGGRHFIKHLNEGNYTGADISSGAIKYAEQLIEDEGLSSKNPELILTGDLKFKSFGKKKFDFILAQSVFTHLRPEHIEECFQHIGKVMSSNSTFFFTYFKSTKYQQRTVKDFCYPFTFFKSLAKEYGFNLEDCSHDYKSPSQAMAKISKKYS